MLDGELGRVVRVATETLPQIFSELTKIVEDFEELSEFLQQLIESPNALCDNEVYRKYVDVDLEIQQLLCDDDVITRISDEISPLVENFTFAIEQVHELHVYMYMLCTYIAYDQSLSTLVCMYDLHVHVHV